MTDLVTTRFITEERGGGVHDATVMEQHIAPPGEEDDPFREADLVVARRVRTFLVTRFPVGYEWCVRSDLRQGVVMISIPILMGVSYWMVINLKQTALGHGVLICAGEILERYGLSRTTFNLGAFLEAREKHSALVVPSRKVPG